MPLSPSLRSAIWSGGLFWARFGINATVFLVISRWIPANELGAYGAAFAVIQIFQAVQTSGVPEYLVAQRHDDDVSTGFWIASALGLAMSLAVLAFSVVAVRFFGEPAGDYFMALALAPLVTGLGVVSESVIRKSLEVRLLTYRTTFSLVVAGAVAIGLAWMGFGGWALVTLTLINSTLSALMNLWLAPWRPSWHMQWRRVWIILRESLRISGRNVIKASINPTIQFVVSGTLGTSAGGHYLLATRFATILSSISLMPAQYAALPIFSRVATDPVRRNQAFVEAAYVLSVISSPIYLGTCFLAPTFLPWILGPAGQSVYPVVQGMLLHSPALVMLNLAVPAMASLQQNARAFWLVVLQLVCTVSLAALASTHSLLLVGWSYAASYLLFTPVYLHHLKRHAGLDSWRALWGVTRPWFSAMGGGMAALIVARLFPGLSVPLELLAQATAGMAVYVLMLLLIARPQVLVLQARLISPALAKLRGRML